MDFSRGALYLLHQRRVVNWVPQSGTSLCDAKSYMKNVHLEWQGWWLKWLMGEKDPVQIPLRSESIRNNAHLFSQSLTSEKMIGWWSHKMISPAHEVKLVHESWPG